jgi:hypothetical protein
MTRSMSIIEMIEEREQAYLTEIRYLRAEVKRLEADYDALLMSSIKHNETMYGNLLKAILDGVKE